MKRNPNRKEQLADSRKVGLIYLRLSVNPNGDESDSPERQLENGLRACEERGWTPEVHEDTIGHNSGRSTEKRPGWQAIEARLGDPDVAGLVANDLSRLHRKGWRVNQLIEFVLKHGIHLVTAAPGRQCDLTTMEGRFQASLIALLDEYYAEDISVRVKAAIASRLKAGKTYGPPPFGTKRDADGYLIASRDGVWLMPDGRFLEGASDNPLHEEALWRRYIDTAEKALTLYATGQYGFDALAYQLQRDRWPYRSRNLRNRKGVPREIDSDAVRRIIENWPEYGGFVSKGRARERNPSSYDEHAIHLNPERAVFPIKLLESVRDARIARSMDQTVIDGRKNDDYPYPVNGLTYCAHCEQNARVQRDLSLRTRLGGKGANTHRSYYRHIAGVQCGASNRSVPRVVYEEQVGQLLNNLTLREGLAIHRPSLEQLARKEQSTINLEAERENRAARERIKRSIRQLTHELANPDLDDEIKAEVRTTLSQQKQALVSLGPDGASANSQVLPLTECLDQLDRLPRLWDVATDELRQALIRCIFQEIVYDLDERRIVTFKLQEWASLFWTPACITRSTNTA